MQYNDFTLIVGHVGRDAEQKYFQDGQVVCNFSVAVDKGKNNDGTERPAKWYNVAAWGKLAEVCAKYVRKGMLVQVVGQSNARGYVDQSGKARASLDLNATSVQFLSRAQGEQGGSTNDDAVDEHYAFPGESGERNLDDIPF